MLVRFYRWLMIEPEPCKSCELLTSLLTTEKYEKKILLENILSTTKQVVSNEVIKTDYEPIIPKTVPWNVRREMLEKEDREQARLIEKKRLEELEQSVGVGQ